MALSMARSRISSVIGGREPFALPREGGFTPAMRFKNGDVHVLETDSSGRPKVYPHEMAAFYHARSDLTRIVRVEARPAWALHLAMVTFMSVSVALVLLGHSVESLLIALVPAGLLFLVLIRIWDRLVRRMIRRRFPPPKRSKRPPVPDSD